MGRLARRAYDRGMSTHTTACPLDCPDTCSLAVTVQGATVTAVEGDARNPLTGGAICGKVRRFAERVHSPLRVERPWIRKPGTTKAPGSFPDDFEPASWDAALDVVAERFAAVRAEHGGQALLPVSYGGSNGLLTEGLVDERLWRRFGALRLHRNICAAPSGAAYDALYGKLPGADLRDHVHSDLIVVWGCNPHATGMHHVAIVQAAQKRGAKLIVVDPRETALAGRADLHLAPHPGTDLVVALALIHELFERGWHDAGFLAEHATGVDTLRARAEAWPLAAAAREARLDPADLERFLELYHAAENPVVRLGWGVERSRSGASACAAILALPAVAGAFGKRGGGFTMSMGRAARFDASAVVGAQPVATREVELSGVGAALLDVASAAGDPAAPAGSPRIHAAFVYNCNPLATLPDQNAVRRGFARADLFTVVHEQVANDSVDYADVVLPATTFVEHHEVKHAYGLGFLYRAEPVVARVGEARPNAEVFGALLERLDLADQGDARGEAELADAIVAGSDLTDTQRASLAANGTALGAFEEAQGETPVPFVDAFPATPSGRIELCPPALAGLYVYRPLAAEEDARYPLALISPAHVRLTTSTFGESLDGIVPVILHPRDLAARGLAEGDDVRIYNALGECHTTVTTRGDAPRPGTAVLPKGLWRKHTKNGLTANALAPAHLSDFGRGACYNDARVQVEAIRCRTPG